MQQKAHGEHTARRKRPSPGSQAVNEKSSGELLHVLLDVTVIYAVWSAAERSKEGLIDAWELVGKGKAPAALLIFPLHQRRLGSSIHYRAPLPAEPSPRVEEASRLSAPSSFASPRSLSRSDYSFARSYYRQQQTGLLGAPAAATLSSTPHEAGVRRRRRAREPNFTIL